MKTVYVTVNINKPKAKEVTNRLIRWFLKKGVKVYFDKKAGKLLHKKFTKPSKLQVDLFISLGGDGTFLDLVKTIYPTTTPIIGINIGSLGFLSEVKLQNMEKVLRDVIKGHYNVDKRMVLEAEILAKKFDKEKLVALNDIVISGTQGRLIELDVHINDEYLNPYRADGLIVSTPTGSTAYSLSAGGPIVNPNLHGIIITPICPHTLTNRPIIVTEDSIIRVFINTEKGSSKLIIDGQRKYLLNKNDIVLIRKSKYPVNLVIPTNSSFYKILRGKLHWG